AAVAEAVVDVRAQGRLGHNVERRFRRVRSEGFVGRVPEVASFPGRARQEEVLLRRERILGGEDDRLVGPDPLERSGGLLLTEDDCRATFRVAARDEGRVARDAEVL